MAFADDPSPRTPRTPACRVAVKVVPASRRDQIVGLLGDRLKIKVSAPPEDGRANAAVCRLLAAELGLPPKNVEVISGHSSPEKTLRVLGLDADALRARWPG